MTFVLKCCGKTDPIGTDKENIRLTFESDGACPVSAWEIELIEESTGLCRRLRPQAFTARPDGLLDATAYRWRVIAQLTDGTVEASPYARFETGISVWEGKWIGGADREDRILQFRKEVVLDSPPAKARLYISGLGYFSPRLNGKALDNAYFIPPVTDYSARPKVGSSHISTGHRVTYYTYDVTNLLQAGSNELTAQVAGGYYTYREKLDYEPQPDFSFGNPCLIYELHLLDQQGNLHKIVSNTDTQVRCTNTVSRLYGGDRVDFTEKPHDYLPAALCPAPSGMMTSPQCEEDRVCGSYTPIDSWQTPEGTVYDFGVNHTGGLRMTLRADTQADITIRYAEVLREDGTLNYETAAWHGKHNITGEKKHIYQENTYRLQAGCNEIAPMFSWFCYRYVLIPRVAGVHILSLRSQFIHMDVEEDGSFRCGNDLLNRISEMFLQTLRCNMHSGLVMDCPHRERLPYTGDGRLVMKSAYYHLDAVNYYYKWFQDILDAQTKEGLIPNSAPYFGGGGGYAWGNAICTVSKLLYSFTADRAVAQQGYEAIVKWLDYYAAKRDDDGIIRSNSHAWMLGDWLAPEVVTSDVYYISTVCYLQAVKTAMFFAEFLDADRWAQWSSLKKKIENDINRVFFHADTCTYGNGVQGENMLALAENIVPVAFRAKMEQNLYRHYTEETKYHLDTGIVLTPVLLNYLTDCGYRDAAWHMMTATTYPSFFNLMENETTICEHWSKKWPDYYVGENNHSRLVKGGGDLSHCHPMYGSVASWLFERVAGLDLTGLHEKKVRICPYFTEYLPWAKAEKKVFCGKVSVRWERTEDGLTLEVRIPAGLTGEVCFPADDPEIVNCATKESWKRGDDGCFRFALPAGFWRLMTKESSV